MPSTLPEAATKPEFAGTPTGLSRGQVHDIKEEAKRHQMSQMDSQQKHLMEHAGQHHSDHDRVVASQQAQAVATLTAQQLRESARQVAAQQKVAEQQKAAAYVQMQQLQEQQRLQEQQYKDAEWLAAQQLYVMKEEAAAREKHRLEMQRALQMQELELQQHTTEHWYWSQQQQRYWQETQVDDAETPSTTAAPAHNPSTTAVPARTSTTAFPAHNPSTTAFLAHNPSTAAAPAHNNQAPSGEVDAELAFTRTTAEAAQAYLYLEQQAGTAAPVVTASPAQEAPSPAPTQLRDSAWDAQLADAAYKRHMGEQDVRMGSPTQLQQELDTTTTQLAGHAQGEDQEIDWAAKAAELEALLQQCRAKAQAATPSTKATGPTPSSTPTRNLAAQFMRVASAAGEEWTADGCKRKRSHEDDWPAPPKAMPRTAAPAARCISAGLPVPPPPLTPEQYEQKMQEIAATIPAPPPVKSTAAKSAPAAWPPQRSQPCTPPEATSKAAFPPAPPNIPAAGVPTHCLMPKHAPPCPPFPPAAKGPADPEAPQSHPQPEPPFGQNHPPAPEAEQNHPPRPSVEAERNHPPRPVPEAQQNHPPRPAPEAERNHPPRPVPEVNPEPGATKQAHSAAAPAEVAASGRDGKLAVFNSVTCPDAWAFLYRLCGRDNKTKSKTSQEITDRGATRNKLLKEFVEKVYQPDAAYDDNKGRLEALFRLKHVSKSWKTGRSGYEWQTEEELVARGWQTRKIAGAVALCTAKKMYKKCMYTGDRKYLVLITETVEQGTERLQELEQLMQETGFAAHDLQEYLSQCCFTEEFDLSLGDCLDLSDSEDEPNKEGKNPDGKPSKKCKGSGLPPLEGSESVEAFVAKYKKTLLNKRSLLKEAKERLEKEECASHREDLNTCQKTMGDLNILYKEICDLDLTKGDKKLGVKANIDKIIRTYIDACFP
ncbi:unnamed protein product, partial [Symbiodinium necroappetens]